MQLRINNEKLIIKNRGFTLVELLLYMALVVIFLSVLTDLFVSTIDLKKESEAISAVEQDGRFILSRLIYDASLSGAGSISINYSLVGNNLVLNGESLNGSETKVTNFTLLELGNIGGKQSVQVKFNLESLIEKTNGTEMREYQVTLGSR